MKHISVIIIVALLVICYGLVLYNLAVDFAEILKQPDKDWAYLLKYRREDLLVLLLIMLSITGLIIKESKGWILTAQFFYSLLGAIITLIAKLDQYMPSINLLTYILAAVALVLPIVLMNRKSVKHFFKIEDKANMLVNNSIAISVAVIVGLIMWT